MYQGTRYIRTNTHPSGCWAPAWCDTRSNMFMRHINRKRALPRVNFRADYSTLKQNYRYLVPGIYQGSSLMPVKAKYGM